MILPEIIKKARQTDLPSFLKSKGEPIKKLGKRYQHRDHDSLIISGNMFFWNSRQAKGNSLDFAMLFYGWSFGKAIEELTGFDKEKNSGTGKEEEGGNHPLLQLTQASDNKRVIAYLCKTRKIKYDLIKQLLESPYLCQADRGNAVFKIYDELGELVGAELVGTLSNVRFKGGTKVRYGFNMTIGQPSKTLFFESPIDLLSFWSLHTDQLTAHWLVSLGGLRQDIFQNTLEKFQIAPETVYLCVDSDEAGQAFITAVQSKYPTIKVYLPKEYKDWNDLLRGYHSPNNVLEMPKRYPDTTPNPNLP